MISENDVARYARRLTDEPAAGAEQLAATRAILAGLNEDGRLAPDTNRLATLLPGPEGRPVRAVIQLDGSGEILRFMVNMLGFQCEFGRAARAVLVDLRERLTPEQFDPMARSLLGADRFAKLHDRFERDWSCVSCHDEIRVGRRYAPSDDAEAICAKCCKGFPDYEARLTKRPADRQAGDTAAT